MSWSLFRQAKDLRSIDDYQTALATVDDLNRDKNNLDWKKKDTSLPTTLYPDRIRYAKEFEKNRLIRETTTFFQNIKGWPLKPDVIRGIVEGKEVFQAAAIRRYDVRKSGPDNLSTAFYNTVETIAQEHDGYVPQERARGALQGALATSCDGVADIKRAADHGDFNSEIPVFDQETARKHIARLEKLGYINKKNGTVTVSDRGRKVLNQNNTLSKDSEEKKKIDHANKYRANNTQRRMMGTDLLLYQEDNEQTPIGISIAYMLSKMRDSDSGIYLTRDDIVNHIYGRSFDENEFRSIKEDGIGRSGDGELTLSKPRPQTTATREGHANVFLDLAVGIPGLRVRGSGPQKRIEPAPHQMSAAKSVFEMADMYVDSYLRLKKQNGIGDKRARNILETMFSSEVQTIDELKSLLVDHKHVEQGTQNAIIKIAKNNQYFDFKKLDQSNTLVYDNLQSRIEAIHNLINQLSDNVCKTYNPAPDAYYANVLKNAIDLDDDETFPMSISALLESLNSRQLPEKQIKKIDQAIHHYEQWVLSDMHYNTVKHEEGKRDNILSTLDELDDSMSGKGNKYKPDNDRNKHSHALDFEHYTAASLAAISKSGDKVTPHLSKDHYIIQDADGKYKTKTRPSNFALGNEADIVGSLADGMPFTVEVTAASRQKIHLGHEQPAIIDHADSRLKQSDYENAIPVIYIAPSINWDSIRFYHQAIRDEESDHLLIPLNLDEYITLMEAAYDRDENLSGIVNFLRGLGTLAARSNADHQSWYLEVKKAIEQYCSGADLDDLTVKLGGETYYVNPDQQSRQLADQAQDIKAWYLDVLDKVSIDTQAAKNIIDDEPESKDEFKESLNQALTMLAAAPETSFSQPPIDTDASLNDVLDAVKDSLDDTSKDLASKKQQAG